MANQMGWAVLCPIEFMAIWNGENDQASIQFQFNGEASGYVSSHFGHGILTFSLGYLFRTPRGHNLWCKGPANDPKDGIAPLEGLIETDWAPYTFTMNWKFTRKAHAVWFREGEPICSLIPYPRAYISEFNPVIRPCSSDPTLQSDYEIWNKSREGFLNDLKVPDSDARKEKWQRAYMVGADVHERQFDEHETRIHVRPFKKL
jgi:hypothetical protein